jgi:hypothetical protein
MRWRVSKCRELRPWAGWPDLSLDCLLRTSIAGNKYRIVMWINYPYRVVYVRFIGTHPQYDGVDAQLLHALRRLASIRLSESWGAVSLCRKQIVSAAVG